MTGLDIQRHRLKTIAACTSLKTNLITGIVTTWGVWDQEKSEWNDVMRMNVIGNMSGLQAFDDNAPLSKKLNQEQDYALQPYWYSEASPAQKEFYLNRAQEHKNSSAKREW